MDVVLELALDHPTLPAAEARAVLDLLGGRATDEEPGVLAATVDDPRALAARLALAHAVLERWAVADEPSRLAALLSGRDLGGRSFAVRARRVAGAWADLDAGALARSLGGALAATGRVDLAKPDVEVRVLLARRAWCGPVVAEVDRAGFESRHVRNRPYFSPVTLHPRSARAMVNLARVRPGDRVLDPFCGTGGLALEAGLVGAKVLASDFDPRMVEGTRATLAHFGVAEFRVEERDVGDAPEFAPEVDAVVADPPYGRSATTAREGAERVFARFLAAAREAVKEGGRIVASFPDRAVVDAPRAGLVLEEAHDVRVHRSLTRTVAVWRRDGRSV